MSPEDQGVWLAEEVPGFAVVGVGVAAGVSLGTKEERPVLGYLAHGQYVPGLLGNNVDRYEIDLGGGVRMRDAVGAMVDAYQIKAVQRVLCGFTCTRQRLWPLSTTKS